MADLKVTALTSLGTAAAREDLLHIIDNPVHTTVKFAGVTRVSKSSAALSETTTANVLPLTSACKRLPLKNPSPAGCIAVF